MSWGAWLAGLLSGHGVHSTGSQACRDGGFVWLWGPHENLTAKALVIPPGLEGTRHRTSRGLWGGDQGDALEIRPEGTVEEIEGAGWGNVGPPRRSPKTHDSLVSRSSF